MYSLSIFSTDFGILDLTKYDIYSKIINIKTYEEEIETKHLDAIAKKYYGDISLWWVIALYNNVVDPFNVNLDVIKVPSSNDLDDILFEIKILREEENNG